MVGAALNNLQVVAVLDSWGAGADPRSSLISEISQSNVATFNATSGWANFSQLRVTHSSLDGQPNYRIVLSIILSNSNNSRWNAQWNLWTRTDNFVVGLKRLALNVVDPRPSMLMFVGQPFNITSEVRVAATGKLATNLGWKVIFQ